MIFHCMCGLHFVYLFICQWTLRLLLFFLAIVSNASMNTSVQIPVQDPTFSSLEYRPRKVIARSYGNLISDFFEELPYCFTQ